MPLRDVQLLTRSYTPPHWHCMITEYTSTIPDRWVGVPPSARGQVPGTNPGTRVTQAGATRTTRLTISIGAGCVLSYPYQKEAISE